MPLTLPSPISPFLPPPHPADSPATPGSPAAGTNPFASPSPSPSTVTRTRSRAPPPMMAPGAKQGGWEKPPGAETDGQRQRSVDMVNEGLEVGCGDGGQVGGLGGVLLTECGQRGAGGGLWVRAGLEGRLVD